MPHDHVLACLQLRDDKMEDTPTHLHGEGESKAVLAHPEEEGTRGAGSKHRLRLSSSDPGVEPGWGVVVWRGAELGGLRLFKPLQDPVGGQWCVCVRESYRENLCGNGYIISCILAVGSN